jgi:hypothetical protein
MTTLSVTNPTLLDLAKRTDPDGSIATIVELLSQTNEMLDDMTWQEGNLPTGHRTTVRTGLPTVTWRKLYGGVQPSKGRTKQVTDNTGMLEAYAEVDKALADLNGNTAAFRLSEDRGFLEAMNQEIQQTILYGNEGTEPEAFTGLTPRYNLLSAANGENIIDALGTGTDNNSIWLVVWGPNTVHGIVPKGSTAGLQRKDHGEVTIENVDGAGGRMQAYRTHYRWDAGLTVRDWRYVVRIANIDKSLLTVAMSTGADIADLMFQAMEIVPNLSMGRPVFYMSRRMRSFFRRQVSYHTKSSTLDFENVGGRRTMTFQGIPIRRVDQLAADEARVL